MAFKIPINLNAVAQGVGGLVFGNDDQAAAKEDKYVERCLDRISNGVLAEDRHAAMSELQLLVADSRSAQLAFGAMGFPVIISVLKEERNDIEMVRGALETLVSALTPTGASHGSKSDIQPSLMNSDLLSRESENISLLLSMLTEDDFYVRYYTLQLLTALLTNSPSRLQEAILTTPHGVTRLMDMLMDREVIRNEALLLLTYLTREAQEIQKIIVFEGAFEKVFSIINEEGGSEGGVVVQDCLDLLNNVLRNNGSNQILLRETIGFAPLISILKLRKGTAYNFTQQKTVNLLGALETVQLLLRGGLQADSGKEAHKASNQTVFAQMKMLDHLLMLGVESRWAPIAVRCMAMYCIGDMIAGHIQNRDMLANKVVGEEPHVEPALNSILRVLLRTAADQEFVAADYVFKCFCKGNPKEQLFLSSTVSAQLPTSSHDVLEKDLQLPFGSLLMYGLVSGEATGNIETCCRAANVLSHILEDNLQCKQQFLRLEPDASVPSLVAREPILHRIFKCLPLSSSKKQKADDGDGADRMFYQPFIIKLFITWLINCPDAVNSFLSSAAHLTYLIEILLVPGVDIFIQGLAAVLLGVCVVYNKSSDDNRDAYMVVNTISQRIGLTQYFLKFEVLKKSPLLTFAAPNLPVWRPLTRSASSEAAVSLEMPDEDSGKNGHGAWKPEHPLIGLIFDSKYLDFIKQIELSTRERVMQVYSQPKSKVSIAPAALQQKDGESDKDYIARLKSFIEKQCIEMQDLLGRNAALAEDLTKGGVSSGVTVRESSSDMPSGRERVQIETLRQEVEESHLVIQSLKSDKAKFEADASDYQQMAAKIEADLKSLSNAYNSLERANFQLEAEVKALRSGKGFDTPDLESVRAEAREEAQKESEAELNDLLVCLGQEQSKVERLSTRLTELGEDVDVLLEGIGDESALQEGGGDYDFDNDDE